MPGNSDMTICTGTCCGTARGRILSGEGVQGLSAAFLSAGVPAVIATLWDVGDRATTLLMEEFYDRLADGRSAAAALQAAQAGLRADPSTHPPYFWAGFVLMGDGDVHLALERRSWIERRLPLTLSLVAALIALALAARRFRPT